ncbi:MAG: ABC transporter substrate-binding protein [Vulcanimicrobiota bacterium]
MLPLASALPARAETPQALALFGPKLDPGGVRRVFAAGPVAAVLAYVLAPTKLMGWPHHLEKGAVRFLDTEVANRPYYGRLAGKASTVSLETLLALKPDLILDVGTTEGTFSSQARRVAEQTGIPYALVPGRLVDSAWQLRQVGILLGLNQRGEDLATRAESILFHTRGLLAADPVRFYLARGSDGLETGLKGSLNTEVFEHLGACNVAAALGQKGLTRVSWEQLSAWSPQVVITQDPLLAQRIRNNSAWTRLLPKMQVRVAPRLPFGWVDGPPGVNRLIGLPWLGKDRIKTDLAKMVCDFYQAFYSRTPPETDLTQWLL